MINILDYFDEYFWIFLILDIFPSAWLAPLSLSVSLLLSPITISFCKRKSTRLTGVVSENDIMVMMMMTMITIMMTMKQTLTIIGWRSNHCPWLPFAMTMMTTMMTMMTKMTMMTTMTMMTMMTKMTMMTMIGWRSNHCPWLPLHLLCHPVPPAFSQLWPCQRFYNLSHGLVKGFIISTIAWSKVSWESWIYPICTHINCIITGIGVGMARDAATLMVGQYFKRRRELVRSKYTPNTHTPNTKHRFPNSQIPDTSALDWWASNTFTH